MVTEHVCSKLKTSYMPSWKKKKGTEMCITLRVITGDHCSKSDSKEEDRGSGTVVCVACV